VFGPVVEGPKVGTCDRENLDVNPSGGYGKSSWAAERGQVCFDFQKGLCQRGSRCRYMHMHKGTVETQQRLKPTLQPVMMQIVMPGSQVQPYPATVQYQPYHQAVPVQPAAVPVQPAATQVYMPPGTIQVKMELPAGWSALLDPKHKVNYYYNMHTSKSQWEKPTSPALPIGVPNVQQDATLRQAAAIQQPVYVQPGQAAVYREVVTQPNPGQHETLLMTSSHSTQPNPTFQTASGIQQLAKSPNEITNWNMISRSGNNNNNL